MYEKFFFNSLLFLIIGINYQAWSSDKEVLIRKGNATRPWQHVIEPLGGYIALACALNKNRGLHGEAFNFGPETKKNYIHTHESIL